MNMNSTSITGTDTRMRFNKDCEINDEGLVMMIADVISAYKESLAITIKILSPLLFTSLLSNQGRENSYSDSVLMKHSSVLRSDVIIVPYCKNGHWAFMVLFRSRKGDENIKYYLTPLDSIYTTGKEYLEVNEDCIGVISNFLNAMHERQDVCTTEVMDTRPDILSTPACDSGDLQDKTTGESLLSNSFDQDVVDATGGVSGDATHVNNAITSLCSKVEVIYKPFQQETTVSLL